MTPWVLRSYKEGALSLMHCLSVKWRERRCDGQAERSEGSDLLLGSCREVPLINKCFEKMNLFEEFLIARNINKSNLIMFDSLIIVIIFILGIWIDKQSFGIPYHTMLGTVKLS